MPKSDVLKEIDGELSTVGSAATVAGGTSFDSTQADVWLAGKTTDNVTEGPTNLYYTDARVSANTDVAANTAARHSAATAGDGIALSGQQVSVDVTPLLGYGLTETANDIDLDLTISPTWTGLHQFNSRVGIGAAADSQFMLDVNGAIRGTYLVGKHAIQLSNVKMLCHYNARNGVANLTGHLGQVPSTADGSIVGVDGGAFGSGAVSLTEGFTNYIINPSFEVDLTGWTASSSDSSATITRDTTKSTTGNASMLLQRNTANWWNVGHTTIAVLNGERLTFSADIYAGPDIVYLNLYNGGTQLASTTFTADGSWVRDTVTWTNSTGSTVNVTPKILGTPVSTHNIYIDSVQATKTAYPLPYRDGTMNGCSWSGTAHASTTTVSAAQLIYDAEDIKMAGTLAFWVKSPFALDGTYSGYGANDWLMMNFGVAKSIDAVSFRFDNAGNAILRFVANSTAQTYAPTVIAETWYHIVFAWDEVAGTYDILVNGTSVQSGSFSGFANTPQSLYVMDSTSNAGAFELNDLTITDYAMSALEVRAIYESNAPVFAETSTQEFFSAGSSGAKVWLDESGIYAEDDTGLPSFALVNIDSKSWNGETLNTRDVLLGDNSTGAANILFDASAGTLALRYGTGDVASITDNGLTLKAPDSSPSAANSITWINATDKVALMQVWRTTIGLDEDVTLSLKVDRNDASLYGMAFSMHEEYNSGVPVGTTIYHYNFTDLPTSATGLSSGDIWNDSGTLKIV